jgi:hypothetical protein
LVHPEGYGRFVVVLKEDVLCAEFNDFLEGDYNDIRRSFHVEGVFMWEEQLAEVKTVRVVWVGCVEGVDVPCGDVCCYGI